jgi:hypothetical protein
MPLPRLIALDIDGTLTRLDGSISASTRAALGELRRLGIVVALATGRPWEIALQALDGLGRFEADLLISSNGATTIDLATRRVVREAMVDAALVEPTVTAARRLVVGAGIAIETDQRTLHEDGFAARLPHGVTMGGAVPDALLAWQADPNPARKVLVFHDDHDADIAALAALLAPHLADGLSAGESGLRCVQVGPAGISKASALDEVCIRSGIDRAATVAVGDGDNDVEMIAWAGLGVAMGNASPVVRAAADRVIAHTDDDGLATFLEELLSPQQ